MRLLLRLMAVGLVALVCCGFKGIGSTYNLRDVAQPVQVFKDGDYLVGGPFDSKGKTVNIRIEWSEHNQWSTFRGLDEKGVPQETAFVLRAFKVEGLPAGTYVMQVRFQNWEESIHYTYGFLTTRKGGADGRLVTKADMPTLLAKMLGDSSSVEVQNPEKNLLRFLRGVWGWYAKTPELMEAQKIPADFVKAVEE